MSFTKAIVVFLIFPTFCLSQKQITLRLVDWASTDEIQIDQKTIAAFELIHPEIKVSYEPNVQHQYEEKILTSLAVDDPPDVFLLDSKLIPTFTNKKVLLNLYPYISKLKIDTLQWFSEAFQIAKRDSGLYAFPKGLTPLMIYYNKKLFDNANIPYPTEDWTWNDYLSIAQKLTSDIDGDGKPDQFGVSFSNHYYYWIPWVWSAGGDVIDPAGMYSTGYLNSPRTESALQFLIDLRNKYHVAPNVGSWAQEEKTGAISSLFVNGKIAMNIDGHWRMPKYIRYQQEGKFDIGVAPLPRSPSGEKTNVMYESGWCVPANSKHLDEAVLLAEFMSGETACRIRSTGNLEIPSNRKAADYSVTNDTLGIEQSFINEISFCRQPWGSRIERFSEIEWILQDAIDEVMLNGKSMHETMTEYASRIDQHLAEIRADEQYKFKPIKGHSDIFRFLIGVFAFSLLGSCILYFRARRKERKMVGTALSFLAPSVLHLVIFVITPIIFSAYLSFHRWDIIVPEKPFVGIGNFSEMFSDVTFWNALLNTLLFSINVPLGMIFSLSVALMLNKNLKGIGLLRTLYFLPSVTSLVAIALVWMWIYHPTFGVLNYMLSIFGIPALQWLNSTQTAMISVIIFSIWIGMGYQMVIFLAGLQSIPYELYDAAIIDGASGWQRFRTITLPLLKPTTFFIFVTSLIGSFQVFTTIYIMTNGGPVRSTDVVVYHIYQAAWEQLRMGYAAAMSWVLFIIIMVATWMQFKLIGKEVEY